MFQTIIHEQASRFIRVVLIFATLVNLASAAEDLNAQDIQNIRQSIQVIDDKVERDFQRLQPELVNITRVVISIGRLGEGKSTLHNLLAGKNLRGVRVLGTWKVDLAENEIPLPDIIIGHGVAAQTSAPNFWRDGTTLYYDCAGLEDNRGPHYDIANVYAIKKLFSKYQNFPIIPLLVSSESAIQNREGGYLRFLRILTGSFNNHIESFGRASCLIVTKQRDFVNLVELREALRDYQNNLAIRLTEQGHNLAGFICNGQLAFFPNSPNGENFLPLGSNERRDVVNSITGCFDRAVPLLNVSPTLSVTAETERYINNLAQNIRTETSRLFADVPQRLYDFCLTQIQNHGNAANFRNYLNTLYDLLNVNAIVGNNINIEAFQLSVQNVLNNYGMPDKYQSFSQNIGFLTYLKEAIPQIDYAIGDWRVPFQLARTTMENAKKVGINLREQDNSLKVQGYFLDVNDVINALRNRQPNPTTVHINPLHTFWFNENFESRGTFTTSGISISLIAPNWRVIGERREFNLSGQNGNNGIHGAAAGNSGTSGRSGGNGAHFYGRGKTFRNNARLNNIDNLIISTNGGNGGIGGNGVNGAQGVLGVNAPTLNGQPIITRDIPTSRGINSTDSSSDWHCIQKSRNIHYEGRGTDGTAGCNGGNGGRGGIFGTRGTALVEGYAAWNHNNQNGTNGQNGTVGIGGTGGTHGVHAQGHISKTWISEAWSKGRYCDGTPRGEPGGGEVTEVRLQTAQESAVGVRNGQVRAPNGANGVLLNDVVGSPAATPIDQHLANAIYNEYYNSEVQQHPNPFLQDSQF